MSTVVPILSNDLTHKVLEWIRKQCCSPNFDPSSLDFQAAIALISASDQYHQNRLLNLINPGNIAVTCGRDVRIEDIPSLSQILIYRSLILCK